MKIYTKTGDDGTTGLFSGTRVSKSSSYVEAYGSVDELNAFVGFAIAGCKDKEIERELLRIQHDLHALGADLATPLDAKVKIHRVDSSRSERLERFVDKLQTELKPITQFILAGGSELAARLHLCRTVCRRAERAVMRHCEAQSANPEILVYLNRLGDLLFVLARAANYRADVSDVYWDQAL